MPNPRILLGWRVRKRWRPSDCSVLLRRCGTPGRKRGGRDFSGFGRRSETRVRVPVLHFRRYSTCVRCIQQFRRLWPASTTVTRIKAFGPHLGIGMLQRGSCAHPPRGDDEEGVAAHHFRKVMEPHLDTRYTINTVPTKPFTILPYRRMHCCEHMQNTQNQQTVKIRRRFPSQGSIIHQQVAQSSTKVRDRLDVVGHDNSVAIQGLLRNGKQIFLENNRIALEKPTGKRYIPRETPLTARLKTKQLFRRRNLLEILIPRGSPTFDGALSTKR